MNFLNTFWLNIISPSNGQSIFKDVVVKVLDLAWFFIYLKLIFNEGGIIIMTFGKTGKTDGDNDWSFDSSEISTIWRFLQ